MESYIVKIRSYIHDDEQYETGTGIIIAENPIDEQISANYGDFVLDREYRYGKIKISTFRHKDFL